MDIIRQWLENRKSLLEQEKKARIEAALATLSRLPAGRALVDLARERKVIFSVTADLPPRTLALFTMQRFIKISPACSDTEMTLAIAHELRHLWQDSVHLVLHQKRNAHHAVIMARFAEADAYAHEAHIAWEMTAQGIDDKAWKTFASQEPGIAGAYESAVKAGNPLQAAFHAFFKCPRLKDDYDDGVLRESREQLQRLQQGQRANTLYDKKRTADQSPAMSVEHLREFGRLFDGANYLAGADTRQPVYIGQLSRRNQRTLEQLEQGYAAQSLKSSRLRL